MANLGGATNSKIVAMVGLGGAIALAVAWLLPKVEHKHPDVVHVSHPVPVHAVHSTPATGPAALHQSMSGPRDYNLSGMAIENIDLATGNVPFGISGI